MRWAILCAATLLWLGTVGWVEAQAPQDPRQTQLLSQVAFEQQLDAQVPLSIRFLDEEGASRALGEVLSDRPAVLVLGYFHCPMLCGLVRDGLIRSVAKLDFTVGEDFDVVYVSIDPTDAPEMARAFRETSVRAYGRGDGAGWWFLTAETEEPIRQLADAVGFRYAYDELSGQYAHPAGVIVLTPQGRISRYLFGVEFDEKDLRFALMEAAQQRIGTLSDLVLLRCYHYDPQTGRYTVAVWRIMRIAGFLTVAGLGALVLFLFRRERHAT
ncbi:MAG: electron transporter SenC [Candidatus Poribacteria bacterium]|nr:MAG: electron transporter SenC [Candidatus Poribacteria bacterium]